MKRNITTMIVVCVFALGLVLSGCGAGGGGSQGSSTTSSAHSQDTTISGAATADTLVGGTVTLKDSTVPVQARKTTLNSDGTYTFITTGLTPPYILKAEWTDPSGNSNKMYSMATEQAGISPLHADSASTSDRRANINSLSDVAVIAAAGDSTPDDLFDNPDPSRYRRTSDDFASIISKLQTVLAPLFAMYNVSGNPDADDNEDGLRAMLKDVRIVVNSGTVTVTNRLTGGVIFSGPLNDLSSGTFHPENMPAGSGGSTTCTSFTYSAWGACQSNNTQIRTVATSSPAGCTGGTPALSQACTYVPSACTYNYSNWSACQSNGTQTRTVTATPAGCTGTPDVLSQSCTYVPPACTYTYSAWAACDSTGNQTRTVASSTPSGCTGTPVLSQTCTYVQPTCSSFTYSAWGACQSSNTQTRTVATPSPSGCTGGSPVLSQACTYVPPVPPTITLANVTASCTGCHGLTVNGNVLASGGYTVSGRTASAWLTTINTMVGLGASLTPAGVAAQDYANFLAALASPTPAACTSFTYSAWGACQSNSTQTRTVATQSPTGCTGGSPVLTQSCTYVPPVTTCTSFTYSAWGACQSSSTQTRTIATQSPTGCTGGSPVLSQACTYVPPTPTITVANVTASCTGCHGLTSNTTVFAPGGYTVSGRTAASWLSTVNTMIGFGASLQPAGVTAQDYANFLATAP